MNKSANCLFARFYLPFINCLLQGERNYSAVLLMYYRDFFFTFYRTGFSNLFIFSPAWPSRGPSSVSQAPIVRLQEGR